MFKPYEDLLVNKERLIIDNFLYANFNNTIVLANKCEIIKNAGFILYMNDCIVMQSFKLKPQEVSFIPINDENSHYHIKALSSPLHTDSLYLVVSKNQEEKNYAIDEEVIRVDDETSCKLYIVMSKFPDQFEEWYQSKKEDFVYKITDSIHNLFFELENKGKKLYLSKDNIISLKEIQTGVEELNKRKGI